MGGRRREVRNGVCLLSSGPSADKITPEWFDPEFWGERAQPVESGGRGSAWFIDTGEQQVVLRRYLRGGLVAKLFRDSYFFTQENSVRSFVELRLLDKMHALQLPVPAPVAAWYAKTSALSYQAAIIIERIRPAKPFGDIWKEAPEDVWIEVGKAVRRFHDADIFHADLNCFNVLLRGESVYLIDFDKGRHIASVSGGSAWKAANLSRLRRSLQREVTSPADQQLLLERWLNFQQGYQQR